MQIFYKYFANYLHILLTFRGKTIRMPSEIICLPVSQPARSYIEVFYTSGPITYQANDKLSLILFSLFRKPQISDTPLRTTSKFVIKVKVPDAFTREGKVYISRRGVELFEKTVLLLLEKELFAFLDKTIVKGKVKQKEAIEVFYTTFNLPDTEKDYERDKKAYYRYRLALEKARKTS